jgi:hypothetical protein
MRKVLETDRPEIDFLIRGRTAADPDHEHMFSTSVSPVRHRDGRVLGVCATVMDITEQHRSRERLALLNEASTYIGSTLDITRTAQELIELAVPRLADFATVDLLEVLLSGEEPVPGPVTGSAVLRRVAHRSVLDEAPESVVRVGQVDVYPVTSPPGRCLATGRSLLSRRMDAAVRRWMAEDPVRAAKTSTYGIHSWLHVPVTARGTTLGRTISRSPRSWWRGRPSAWTMPGALRGSGRPPLRCSAISCRGGCRRCRRWKRLSATSPRSPGWGWAGTGSM